MRGKGKRTKYNGENLVVLTSIYAEARQTQLMC
jgi:hypothetical protein